MVRGARMNQFSALVHGPWTRMGQMAQVRGHEHSECDAIPGSLETEILLRAMLYLIGNNIIKRLITE